MVVEDNSNSNIKLCECGCKQPVVYDKYRPRRFINGHYWKNKKGKNHGAWNGGVFKSGDYWRVNKPDHPKSSEQGIVMAHRLIYEHYLKILFDEDVYIPNNYHIHHIIPVKEGGTNALINLELISNKEHVKIHSVKDMSDRLCIICKSDKTWIDEKGHSFWYKYEDALICKSCYEKIRRKTNKNKG